MIIGGLSEKELAQISELLDFENINYEVSTDDSMVNANNESMGYNLRHLHPPNISTSILAIKLQDNAFESMSEDLKKKLLDYGVTDQVPEEFNELDAKEVPESIHSQINHNNKKMVGTNFLLQAVFAIVMLLVYWLINSKK